MNRNAKLVALGLAGFLRLGAAHPTCAAERPVAAALDSLEFARRALTDALFRGDTDAMDRSGALRGRSLLALEEAAADTAAIRALSCEAQAGWLEASLRERRPEWSRAVIDLAGELPEAGAPGRGRLALAIGLAEETQRGDTLAAIAHYRIAAESHDVLRDEALYRAWRLTEASGDSAGALVWADSLATAHAASPRTPFVRLARARALRERDAHEDALAEIRLAAPDLDGAEIRWFIATTQLALGRPLEAARELEELILRFALEPGSVRAFAVRDTLGVELPLEARIDLLAALLVQPPSGAEARLRALADSTAIDPALRTKAVLSLTRYLYRAKRYADAESLLAGLLADPDARTSEEASLVIARIHRNAGRIETMRPFYEAVIDSGGAEAPTALWELGRELESQGAWEEAAEAYSRLLERHAAHERARDARFRRGFAMVRLGRLEEASEDFRGAFQKAPLGPDGEQAAFWLARTLRDLGRAQDALDAARAGSLAEMPEDLYGVLLRERFQLGVRPPAFPATTLLDPARPLAALASGRGWPPEAEERFQRGLDLAALGVKDAARGEWSRALLAGADSSLVEALALCAVAYDLYPEGVRWARIARDHFPQGHGSRAGYERLFYPSAYHADVMREGDRNGLDPHLLWALIRQESFYDPLAMSRAGARGLMQMLPATLDRMIREGSAPPLTAEALFRPDLNIALGTRFLAERLEEFDGRLLPTLASYNAGEGKAREWLELSGGEAEEVFVECVGYRETYGYVRRIPWLAWVYGYYYDRGKKADTAGSEAR